MRTWREVQQWRPGAPLTFSVTSPATTAIREVVVEQPAIWSMDTTTWAAWLRLHLGPLSQMTAFLAGAAVLMALGAHGSTAVLMEFVPGEDLRHLLKRERRLAPEQVTELLAGIAGGVESAHKAGILHRDLKPENLLLPESGTGPKVVDFGGAKLSTNTTGGGTLTGAGTIVGTPAYMAPEQLRGEGVDGRADVFSLGVMTFEMLTGTLPYGGASLFDIGMKQAAGAATVNMGDMPEGMAAAVRRAIAFDKDMRPASPVAFANELKRITRNE